MAGARSGVLPGGLPYRAVGDGPAVVVFPALTGDNTDPSGRLFAALTWLSGSRMNPPDPTDPLAR